MRKSMMEELIMRGYYKDNLIWVKYSDSNRAFYEKSYYGNLYDKNGERIYYHDVEETDGENISINETIKGNREDTSGREDVTEYKESIDRKESPDSKAAGRHEETSKNGKRKVSDDKISLQFEFKTPKTKTHMRSVNEPDNILTDSGKTINNISVNENGKKSNHVNNSKLTHSVAGRYSIPDCIPIEKDEIDVKFLAFHPMEALYLIERKKMRVYSESLQEIGFDELLQRNIRIDPKFWQKYIVYRDIRFRGYIIRIGYGGDADFRVYARGAKFSKNAAKYVYFIIREGIPVPLSKLQAIVNQTSSDRKELILAIFDSLGDSTFYQLENVKFNTITDFDEIWNKESELEQEIDEDPTTESDDAEETSIKKEA